MGSAVSWAEKKLMCFRCPRIPSIARLFIAAFSPVGKAKPHSNCAAQTMDAACVHYRLSPSSGHPAVCVGLYLSRTGAEVVEDNSLCEGEKLL